MEAKCYRAMRRAQCVVLKKFSQHVIAETLTQTCMGAKCYRAMRRAEQRHSPRRIAKHPELSGLLTQFGPQFGTISMKDDRGKKA